MSFVVTYSRNQCIPGNSSANTIDFICCSLSLSLSPSLSLPFSLSVSHTHTHKWSDASVDKPGICVTSLLSCRDKEMNRRLQEAEQKYREERGRMVLLEQTLENMNLDSNKGQWQRNVTGWTDDVKQKLNRYNHLLDPLPLQIPLMAAWSHSVLPVWFLRVAFFFLRLKISKNVLLIMTSISSIWQTWACVAAGTLPVGSNLCVGTVEACSCCSHDCFYSWGKGEAPRALLKSTLHRDLWLCSDVMRQVKHVSLQARWQPSATH